MAWYNGFSDKDRSRAARRAKRAGHYPKPGKCSCEACGRSDGVLEWHSEDYTEPVGPWVGEWLLCYTCHRALHRRFIRPLEWQLYRVAVRFGRQRRPEGWTTPNHPRRRTLLDAIHDGECFPSRLRIPGPAYTFEEPVAVAPRVG